MSMHTVILAGGSGTRLWPISRESNPKQFLKFCQDGTMLQKTFRRNQIAENQKNYFLININHVLLIKEQLQELGADNYTLIIEPESKNTAPAIIAAALNIYKDDPDGIMIISPSDNEVKQVQEYQSQVLAAKELARLGYYVVFGITPTRPEIAYGYIKQGAEIASQAYIVEKFVEKPDIAKACAYLKSSNYYWNSGIFVLPVKRFLEEINLFEPDMVKHVRNSIKQSESLANNIFLAKEPFSLDTVNKG